MTASDIDQPLPSADATGSTRFVSIEVLGRGMEKTVYRAYDVILKREVAVALFHETADGNTSPEDADTLLAEAQAMARVSAHEGIVTIFDVTKHQGEVCMVMEFHAGGNLRTRMARGLSRSQAVEVMRKLLAALAYAHDHGLTHGDVKPENIVFDAQGQPHLTDFGFARHVDSYVSSEYVDGTPEYLAPECVDGTKSPGSDLYACGCLFYEMLTGAVPFEGRTAEEVVRRHLHTPPRPPRERMRDLPPLINRMCMRLLEKQPGKRPASARVVLEDLSRIDTKFVNEPDAHGSSQGWVDREARASVGRTHELDVIESVLTRLDSRMVLIEGEAGVGKTHLLDHARSHAEECGYRVWQGTALEGGSLPLQPIIDCVLPHQQQLLEIVPEAEQPLAALYANSTEGAFETALYQLAMCLFKLAKDAPLVLVLDDMQWADQPTLRLIDHVYSLLRTAGSDTRLVIFAATRPVDDQHRLRVVSGWRRSPQTLSLNLKPLTRKAIGDLIVAMTGLPPTKKLVDLVESTTQGNTLFVRELLVHLDATSRLSDRDGSLTTDVLFDEVEMPKSLLAAVGFMVDRLSPAGVDLIRYASCLGTTFQVGDLSRMPGRSRSDVLDDLVDLENSGLVEGKGDVYRFRHPLFRNGIYDAMSNAQRIRSHRTAATVLLGGAGGGDQISIAGHAAIAVDLLGNEVSVALMSQAAHEALEKLAWPQAILISEAVLDCTTVQVAEAERIDFHYVAASAYHQNGEVQRAASHLSTGSDLARETDDQSRLAEILQLQIRARTNFGGVSPGSDPHLDEFERLIEQLTGSQPSLCARMMVTMSLSLDAANQIDAAEQWAQRAWDLAQRVNDDRLLGYVGSSLALAQWKRLDPGLSLETWRATRAAAGRAGDIAHYARAIQRVPYAHCMLGDLEAVQQTATQARNESSVIYQGGELTITILAELMAMLVTGDFKRARVLAAEGLELIDESRYVGVSTGLISAAAYTYAACGEFKDARETMARLLKPGKIFDEPEPLRPAVNRQLALIRALAGEREAVAQELVLNQPPQPPATLNLRRLTSYCLTAETAWEVGAVQLVEQCQPAINRSGGVQLVPGWPFVVTRLQACLAAMAGENAEAETLFEAALEFCRQKGMPAEEAKTHLSIATYLTRYRETPSADRIETHCGQAERLFTSFGMTPYLQTIADLRAVV